MSKVFEKLVFKQLSSFFEGKLSKFLCGFRKKYSSQHALLNLINNWYNKLDANNKVGAVLMDLSKAYDTLPHDLLIAKLAAYGLGNKSLNFLLSYLKNRKQRVRIGSYLSEWLLILLGVPQGSILGPILFNIFLNDLLLFLEDYDVCNFADDNTISVYGKTSNEISEKLEVSCNLALDWFKNNSMVANPKKFQVLYIDGGREDSLLSLNINGKVITSTETVKLLGLTIDNKLTFNQHITTLCRNASSKSKALLRIRHYLSYAQANVLCNAYILSAFTYCPIVWMFCSKKSNNLVDSVYKRGIRTVENDFTLTLEEILTRTNRVNCHRKNLELLLIEMYKSINSINPVFMWDIFPTVNSKYALRSGHNVKIPSSASTMGTKSFVFRGALAWNHLDKRIKEAKSPLDFINALKNEPIYCHCKICS